MFSLTRSISCFGLCFISLFICGINSELNLKNLDEVVAHVVSCRTNPAITVSVVRDNDVVFCRGYGQVKAQGTGQVTNKTLFGVASLSKAFASTLLLKILHRHKISIKATVVDVLGRGFQFYDSMRTKYATLEDLLSHSLGIPSHSNLRFDTNLTRALLPKRLKYLKATGEFRNSFVYSNVVYGLVMHITERLGGKSWEELVKEEIFVPLGMMSSSFVTKQDLTSLDVAQALVIYGNNEKVPVDKEMSRRWGIICASGCVMSTAEDMAKWMRFHVSHGFDVNGTRVMDAKLMSSMYTARNAFPHSFKYFERPSVPVTTSSGNYALGWRRGYYRGYPIITHTGTTIGYQAIITLIPSRKFGVFIASTGNDDGYLTRVALTNYITDLFLGETPWLNRTTLCSFPKPWVDKTPLTYTWFNNSLPYRRNTSAYEGVFVNDAYGNLEVYFNTMLHRVILKYGFGKWALYPIAGPPDSFYGVGLGINAEKSCRSLVFRPVKHNPNVINMVEMTCFEHRQPPVFIRRKGGRFPSSNSQNPVFTMNVLFLVTTCVMYTVALTHRMFAVL